jgi:hypothetical protein
MTAMDNAVSMFCGQVGLSVTFHKLESVTFMTVYDTNVMDWMVISLVFDTEGNLLNLKCA